MIDLLNSEHRDTDFIVWINGNDNKAISIEAEFYFNSFIKFLSLYKKDKNIFKNGNSYLPPFRDYISKNGDIASVHKGINPHERIYLSGNKIVYLFYTLFNSISIDVTDELNNFRNILGVSNVSY